MGSRSEPIVTPSLPDFFDYLYDVSAVTCSNLTLVPINHYVGIQCRRLDKPMAKAKILADCSEALTIKAWLKEIIFATTCQATRA